MPANIPENAFEVEYKAANGKTGRYYTWPHTIAGAAGKRAWYWAALGNNGVASTQVGAEQAAKEWIRDSDNSSSRPRD